MSFQDFMLGFAQGFNRSGGIQRLSSWAAKNIADGKYYDPESDPLFYQSLETARTLNTPASRQSFVDDYGQYYDTKDMSPEEYFFSPVEGSPEWIQQESNRLNLDNQRLLNQMYQTYLPKQYEREDEIGDIDLGIKRTYAENYPIILGLETDLNRLALDEGRFDFGQKQKLAPLQHQTAVEQLNALQTNNKYLEQSLIQNLEAGELQNYYRELQNQLTEAAISKGEELLPYEIELIKLNVLNSQIQNKLNQSNLDYMQDTYDERVRSIGLGNEYQDIQNQLAGLELGQMLALQEMGFLDGTAGGADTTFNWDRYIGLTPDNRPVMETVAGGRLALNPDGNLENWTGVVIGPGFSISETNQVGEDANGIPLYKNNNDIVIYKDGTPYVDEEGNQYYVWRGWDNSLRVEPFKLDFTSGVTPEVEEKPGFIERLVETAYSNMGNTPQYTESTGNQVIDDITRDFILEFGRGPISHEELIDVLGQVPDELIQQEYGISKAKLINQIQQTYMRKILNESPNI